MKSKSTVIPYIRKYGGIALSATTIISILGVSLPHLMAGIQSATGASPRIALLTGIVIDIGMISAEYAALTTKRTVHTTTAMLIGLILSAVFNCIEFAKHSVSLHAYAVLSIGIILGIAVPLLAYCNIQILHAQTSRAKRTNAQTQQPTKSGAVTRAKLRAVS